MNVVFRAEYRMVCVILHLNEDGELRGRVSSPRGTENFVLTDEKLPKAGDRIALPAAYFRIAGEIYEKYAKKFL